MITELTLKEKQFLFNLARRTIEVYLKTSQKIQISPDELPSARLKEERATFVTLTKAGQLRGCIGHITPGQALFLDVIENAYAAAFLDPRFPPLSKDEFQKINIEISILSISKKLKYQSLDSLIEILEKNKLGVILKRGSRMATFLPQVWEELPKAVEFLSHLCLKARLNPDEWTRKVEVETYKVEKISSKF